MQWNQRISYRITGFGEGKIMRRPGSASSFFCWASVFAGLIVIAGLLSGAFGNAWCADTPTAPANSDQMDVTIVHVDKYAVYAPDLVFYWDTAMSKKQISALTSAAQRLRGKKALITFTRPVNSSKDTRNILLDITPYKEAPEEVPSMETAMGEPEPLEQREVDVYGHYAAPEPTVQDTREPVSPVRPALPVSPTPKAAPTDESPYYGDRAVSTSSTISREELTRFVESVLRLSERKDMDGLLSHYAPRVNYYNRGEVDQNYIRKDLGYYFRNWDIVESSLDGRVVMIVTDQPDVRIVKFISTFYVHNPKKTVSGRTENIWKVQRLNWELKIVDQKQKILESETR
jgi:hypothetical protein